MTHPYIKPWLTWDQQLALLEQRGLVVEDRQAAIEFLAHVNYYRFSGYCLAFEIRRHRFRPGTTFRQVEHAYEFDRVLRDLVIEALEVVEIDLRTAVAYRFGKLYGAFGHCSGANFHQWFQHSEWLSKLRSETDRSRERFVEHFRTTYSEFPDLPVWAVTEITSFGSLSRMYSGMLKSEQTDVARRYGVQVEVMRSWIHHLVYVRNVCAHHARLWDRVWAIKPRLPHGRLWQPPALPGNHRLFTTMLVLSWLLRRCNAANRVQQNWRARVTAHLASLPRAPEALALLGLGPRWDQNPLWVGEVRAS